MPFDHSARRQQIARIISHAAGDEILLRWNGEGQAFSALIASERPKGTQADQNTGALNLMLVTIARAVTDAVGKPIFTANLPREGQHFTDTDGKIYRIQEDRSVAHHPCLVYACGTVARLTS